MITVVPTFSFVTCYYGEPFSLRNGPRNRIRLQNRRISGSWLDSCSWAHSQLLDHQRDCQDVEGYRLRLHNLLLLLAVQRGLLFRFLQTSVVLLQVYCLLSNLEAPFVPSLGVLEQEIEHPLAFSPTHGLRYARAISYR